MDDRTRRVPAQIQTPRVRPLPQPIELRDPWIQEMDPQEAELRRYFKVVIQYRFVVLATTVLSVLLFGLYAFTATPFFTAESRLRISTYEPVLASARVEDMLQEKSKESNYLETQIQELKSFSLADRVLQEPDVVDAVGRAKRGDEDLSKELSDDSLHPGVTRGGGYRASLKLIKRYLDLIAIKPIRRTSLVAIEVTHRDPQLAALISNRHTSAYIDWVRLNRVEQQSSGLRFLRAQAEELREKVTSIEREMADYAEANSIVALNKDENIIAQKMSQLNKLLTEVTGKRIELERLYAETQKSLSSNAANNDDVGTQNIRAELAKLEGERAHLGAKFTDSYPRVKEIDSQVARLKASIKSQREQLVGGLKAKADAARAEETELKEELELQKSKAFDLSKRQVQYNVLDRELTSSRELLQTVLKQMKETSLAVESNASNVSVVDYAAVPNSPSYPRRSLLLVLGLFVGATCGTALAFLINYLDNTIRTPDDVTSVLRLPSLGVVPSFGEDGISGEAPQLGAPSAAAASKEIVTKGDNAPIEFLKNPRSLASEAYRSIRTAILLSQAGEPPRTILVSSAQSSEGKTTSTVNLAASLASAGARVALIDADLRRPNLGKQLKLASNLPGLVEVLTGQRTLLETAVQDAMHGITVIPSGKIPPNPAELLASLEMASVIDHLAGQFDYVIIDSPPILPVTDTVILSRYVDGVVLVVRGSVTPRKVVLDATERLRAVGARVLGAILNDVDFKRGAYSYYARYYQGYYETTVEGETRKAAG